jgi:hypothetical protein
MGTIALQALVFIFVSFRDRTPQPHHGVFVPMGALSGASIQIPII